MGLIYEVNNSIIVRFGARLNEATPYFYNVSHSVGEGGVNEKNDVLLIQNLLNIVAPKMKSLPLRCDGVCGHKTLGLINTFQKMLKIYRSGINDDGRFDPVRNHDVLTPSKLHCYTIFLLNTSARLDNYHRYFQIGRSIPLSNRHLFSEMKSHYDKYRFNTTLIKF